MDVTPTGMLMAVSELVFMYAPSPMEVTPAGMVMAVSELASENA
jgi:hypothetical protein